ncbi:MAG: low temperature requirement protein A [Lactobacillus sp.]|uniref:low temperature requirement protein A n=1 Tax=Lactobacillus sp. TaxID=1591 RepID=UPI0023D3B370|nr:low temperature requirement protein A [Lactobacillus sp.]MDE7049752.1 low temperature requirement protein A [Lactobacillus sp.]
MQAILNKRVSKIALFYDLVFVYMISKTTEILHHLEHGLVSPTSFALFALIVIIFINSWMVQTVFTNRYGIGSWADIAFYFIDMMILLYMSNSFDTNNLTEMKILFISAGLLSLTLASHYLINYFQTTSKIDQNISRTSFLILIFRSIALIIGGLLDNVPGFVLAVIGIIFSWLMPTLTAKYTIKHPIIFPHLLERLNLLVIIIFGETIIGIADYFRPKTFSLYSILIFLTVALLFFTYALQFDKLTNEDQDDVTGNVLIYLHYLIIFGISLITVSIKFIHEADANSWFAVLCLYCGIGLFYLGLLFATRYNKLQFKLKKSTITIFLTTTLIGTISCLIWSSFEVIVILTFVIVVINISWLVHVNLPHIKKGILL